MTWLAHTARHLPLRPRFSPATKLNDAPPDSPLGEFLNIGMAPIATRDDRREIFTIGNGGAGLLLTGTKADDDTKFHDSARFVFVRQRNVASSQARSD